MSTGGPFGGLVDEEIATVAFVMDYVEFHFNGPRVRALVNPFVHAGGIRSQFPTPGSRDALCSLIGQPVATVEFRSGQALVFSFQSGDALTIPLDAESYIGPEAPHWHPDNDLQNMVIW